jgi:hypothetical protein
VRRLVLAFIIVAGLVPFARPGIAAPCDVEMLKVESWLQRVLEPERRQAIEAILDEAKRALMLHEPDRCMTDVNKAKRALRLK